MSYGYVANQKTYSTIEQQNNIYVFEIAVTYFDNTIIKQRVISIEKIGELLIAENNIKKIKVTLCFMNSMDIIVLKKHFNQSISESIILHKENTFIILNSEDQMVHINYRIL